MAIVKSDLLLEIGVPFRSSEEGLLVESQALNGMRLWAKHFDHVSVCAPCTPTGYRDTSSIVWANPGKLLAEGRVSFEPLPWGYHPRDHFRYRSGVRKKFDELVGSHRYLCFSNIGVFGAWGSFGVGSARRQRRPYSLWFDWVLHKMDIDHDASFKARLRGKIFSSLTKRLTDVAVRDCSLGLFHGKTVYDAYAPICRRPELVHDVHVGKGDAVTDDELNVRMASLSSRAIMRIGYVGRVHPMKAPLQWIEAVAQAVRNLGPNQVQATWLGDGPLLDEARQRVKAMNLDSSIHFAGFVSSRNEVLSFLKGLDIFVFTHVTPESPRVLIEALISGLPLVGYASSYASELVGKRGGALLSPIGNPDALASNIIHLGRNRDEARQLTRAAALSRPIYNDEAVFAHRSDLIKKYL